MEYLVSFRHFDAFLDICVEASSKLEAKEKAKELALSGSLVLGFACVPPIKTISYWDCNVWVFSEYESLNRQFYRLFGPRLQRSKVFLHGKVLAFQDQYINDWYNDWDW